MLKVLLTIGLLQFLTMLVMLVRTKSLALLLGPELLGVMAVIDKLLAVLSQTISLSFPFAAVRFLPALWTRDPEEFVALYRRMRNLLLSLAVVAGALGLAAAAGFPATLGPQLLPYRWAVVAAFLSLPVVTLVPFLTNAAAGRLEQNRSMVVSLAHAVVLTLASILGVLWGGLAGVYLLYAAAGLAFVAIVSRQLESVSGTGAARSPKTRTAGTADAPRSFLGVAVRVWRFSAALFGLTFVAPYAAWYVHYNVLRELGGQAAGFMQAAIGISLAVRSLLGSAHAVFLTPNVNRGGSPEERMRWADEFQKTLCFLCGLSIPLLLLFPQLAVRLLYSGAFLPGASFVALFVIAETLTLLSGTYQALIVAFDHLGFHVAQNVAAQLLLLGTAMALLPSLGIAAAGIAALTAPIFLYGATTSFLRWRYRLRVPFNIGSLAAFVVASLALAGFVGARNPGLGWETILLKLALYGVLVGVLALFLTAADRERLGRLLAELRDRAQAPSA